MVLLRIVTTQEFISKYAVTVKSLKSFCEIFHFKMFVFPFLQKNLEMFSSRQIQCGILTCHTG